MNRRRFLQNTTIGAAAAMLPVEVLRAAETKKGVNWPVGCMNRPWNGEKKTWGLDVALDGAKAAGYKVNGLLTRSAKEPLLGSDATPEYLAQLKERIAARGLQVKMGALRNKNELPLDEQIKDMRKQVHNGKTVGVEYLLTFGVDKSEHVENYYKLMQNIAPYAQDHGMKVVLKPHGGASGAAEEITRCLEQVKQPNFNIWFDAGNIVFYTGKDPVEQLKPIVRHVTGFCAKDCDQKGGKVQIEFGTGKVDFSAVFGEMKKAGFNGPILVECCAPGETPDEVTANARKNREYLEKVLASV
jgi:sugar phosphate isomerase/epimerase